MPNADDTITDDEWGLGSVAQVDAPGYSGRAVRLPDYITVAPMWVALDGAGVGDVVEGTTSVRRLTLVDTEDAGQIERAALMWAEATGYPLEQASESSKAKIVAGVRAAFLAIREADSPAENPEPTRFGAVVDTTNSKGDEEQFVLASSTRRRPWLGSKSETWKSWAELPNPRPREA